MRRLRRLFAVLVTMPLALACGGTFEEARDARISISAAAMPVRDPVQCASISARETLYTDAAWVDGSLAGASGVVAGALPSDVPSGWRIGLGAAAGAFASLAVYATTAANKTGTEYVQECAQ